ncbi:hypothetical protein HYY69_03370 [Candidatus Woesearchaeota archaeon]|nr:hypothetical protein [Candidatus Woesearchaeota archaeon]
MIKNIKEKIIAKTGTVSGAASILASWQVCHNVCLVLVGLLSVIGITIVGMPLAFLTKYAVVIWSIALVLLLLTVYFYVAKKCISLKLILFNSGLLIAGIPFPSLQKFIKLFWLLGGAVILISIILFIKEKYEKYNPQQSRRRW